MYIPSKEELTQIDNKDSLLFEKNDGEKREFYALRATTVAYGRHLADLNKTWYTQEDWLRPLIKRLAKLPSEEKATVFYENAYSNNLKDINHNRFELGDISYEVHGKMKRKDILAAFNAAIAVAEKEFLESGKLAELNEKVKAQNAEKAAREEATKAEKAQMLAAVEEKVKDEKLDLKDHDVWFEDFKKTPSADTLNEIKIAERWGKLMQIRMRENFGLLTPKIIKSTFKEASLGGDHWFDCARQAYNNLALGWNHGKALVALTNPTLFFKALKLRKELKNERYIEQHREEYLKNFKKYNGSSRDSWLRNLTDDGVDYLQEKEKLVRDNLNDKNQKMGNSGHSGTGQIDAEQMNTTQREIAFAKAAMLARKNKEDEKIANVSREGVDYLQEKAKFIKQRLAEKKLQMGDTGDKDGQISATQQKTGKEEKKIAGAIMKARRDRMNEETK